MDPNERCAPSGIEACEYCGANCERGSLAAKGWQPDQCTGACGIKWRDPDAEYEARRERFAPSGDRHGE